MYTLLISILSVNFLLGFIYWFKRIHYYKHNLLGVAIFPYSFVVMYFIRKIILFITNDMYWIKR